MLEIRFPVKIFMQEPISNSYTQGNLREPVLLHVYLLGAYFSSNYFLKNKVTLGSPGNNC
jgi:hypothetical protein